MIVCPWKDIKKYASLLPGIDEAFDAVNALTEYENKKNYPLSNGNRFFVAVETTKEPALAEAHRNYLDIQYLYKGEEMVGWAPLETLTLEGEFNTEKDVGLYAGPVDHMRIAEGYCYVAFPEDGHMPAVHLDTPKDFVKVVVKLKV
jgi:YhcH/YjgK/YiaL family protein